MFLRACTKDKCHQLIFNACNQRLHVVSFRAKMELSFYSINFTLQTPSTYLRAVLIGSGGVIFSINFFNSVAFLFEGLKPFSNVSSSILSRLMRIARLLEPLCLCECVWGGGLVGVTIAYVLIVMVILTQSTNYTITGE